MIQMLEGFVHSSAKGTYGGIHLTIFFGTVFVAKYLCSILNNNSLDFVSRPEQP